MAAKRRRRARLERRHGPPRAAAGRRRPAPDPAAAGRSVERQGQADVNPMKPQREADRRRGASILEAAIVLPVALLLCMGAMDFSRLAVSAARLQAASATAAAQGAREPDDLDAARRLALADLDPQSSISLEPVCVCPSAPSARAACEQLRCGGAPPRHVLPGRRPVLHLRPLPGAGAPRAHRARALRPRRVTPFDPVGLHWSVHVRAASEYRLYPHRPAAF